MSLYSGLIIVCLSLINHCKSVTVESVGGKCTLEPEATTGDIFIRAYTLTELGKIDLDYGDKISYTNRRGPRTLTCSHHATNPWGDQSGSLTSYVSNDDVARALNTKLQSIYTWSEARSRTERGEARTDEYKWPTVVLKGGAMWATLKRKTLYKADVAKTAIEERTAKEEREQAARDAEAPDIPLDARVRDTLASAAGGTVVHPALGHPALGRGLSTRSSTSSLGKRARLSSTHSKYALGGAASVSLGEGPSTGSLASGSSGSSTSSFDKMFDQTDKRSSLGGSLGGSLPGSSTGSVPSAHENYYDLMDDYYYDLEVEEARQKRAMSRLQRQKRAISRLQRQRKHARARKIAAKSRRFRSKSYN